MFLGRWTITHLKIVLPQKGIWILREEIVVSDTMVKKQTILKRPLTNRPLTSKENINKQGEGGEDFT